MSRGSVVITGASSGLGEEMARQLAALGYDLGVCARRTDRLERLRDEITLRHPDRRVEVRALDVTDDDAVFAVAQDLAASLGRIDRFVVNAGLGKGAPLGTGRYDANRETAMVNFVGALAQMEAALQVFRAQGGGHLVVVSSISALRGMRRAMTTYAATKAGVASLAEGVRSERIPGVVVTTVYPGYIRSEMNEHVPAAKARFMVDTPTGVRAIVDAVERQRATAYVPAWPWVPLGLALRLLPLSVVRRLV